LFSSAAKKKNMANNVLNYVNLKLATLGVFLLMLYFGFTHKHVLLHCGEVLMSSPPRPPSGSTGFYGLSLVSFH